MNPLLGLHLIVRDAEDSIAKLLDSVINPPAHGPAFDEFVIVDTGSVDKTKDLVAKAFKLDGWTTGSREVTFRYGPKPTDYKTVSVVLGEFDWIDDFSAARQYSFELGTATWRAWLDADDTLENADRLLPTLQRTIREKPHVNTIVLPYQYDALFIQDKVRAVKWADGFHWQDEIHEHLERNRGPKIIAKYTDLVVVHHQDDAHALKSLDRNIRICTKIYEKAFKAGDKKEAGLMAYYLGQYARAKGYMTGNSALVLEALGCYDQAGDALAFSNIGSYAMFDKAQTLLGMDKLDEAAVAAGTAHSYAPELPEGELMLGVTHSARGDYSRAALVFDQAFARARSPYRDHTDVVFNEGIARVHAAKAYAAVGRNQDAIKQLGLVPPEVRADYRILKFHRDVQTVAMKQHGLEVAKQFVDYLIWDTQPQLALKAIEECMPAAIEDTPQLAAIKREVEAKIPHCFSWESYKHIYDTMPREEHSFHANDHQKEMLLNFGRCKNLVAWGSSLKKTMPDKKEISVLSIGCQEAIMETELMKTDSRIKLTVCDASELAGPGFQKLAAEFPGRVLHHHVREGHWDWPDGPFDMVYMFEVLEHIPDPEISLDQLARRIKNGGTLLLSTPVADRWIEPYLTDPKTAPKYLYHIQAFTPTRLLSMFRDAGFWVNRMIATEQGGQFFVNAKFMDKTTWLKSNLGKQKKVSIYVPGTPLPFDPDSVHTQHVGGSEEAVIYLAPELAKLGYDVTIYSPRPERKDDVIVHAQENVLWRDTSDFDMLGDHENVLFWRVPSVMSDETIKKAPYKKFMWLHDATHYADQDGTATPEGITNSNHDYGSSDGVICLTKAHAEAIKRWDGYSGSNIKFAMNGIRVSDFPELTLETEAQRDPFKCVWGSSPDRGLHTLLALWPLVKAEVPQATLDIYYDWGQFFKRKPETANEIKTQIDKLKDLGVTLVGGVSHDKLHDAFRKASVYSYAQIFYEIYMISAIKAAACGTFLLANSYGSLPEVVIDPARHLLPRGESNEVTIETIEGQQGYARALINLLKNPPTFEERKRMSDWARANFGWEKAAVMFAKILDEPASEGAVAFPKVLAMSGKDK